jgi:hypothetical protein
MGGKENDHTVDDDGQRAPRGTLPPDDFSSSHQFNNPNYPL